MKLLTRRTAALFGAFIAGPGLGCAVLAAIPIAFPVIEFPSEIGSFVLLLRKLVRIELGFFLVLFAPFLFLQSARNHRMRKRIQICIGSAPFIVAGLAAMIVWRAYYHWVLAVSLAGCAAALTTTSVFGP